MNQLDFINDFEAADRERATADRQKEVTHEIIDSCPAAKIVKALLHMLADFPKRVKDEKGNWHITASISKMESRLGKTRNTVRSYIKSACQTPYLEILDPNVVHDERTYVIHWRSILDRETTRPDATSTASHHDTDSTDATSTSDIGSRGSKSTPGGGQFPEARGSTPNTEGVNFDTSGGQIDRGQIEIDRGEFPSSEERLKDVLKAQVNKTSNPDVFKNVFAPGGGQSRKRQNPMRLKFWKQWEEAVLMSDLGNPRHVQDLYEMITSMCVFSRSESNRHRVFANAAMNERMWKSGEALKRKGLFMTNTPLERWFFNHLDELVATRMIHNLEHPSGPSIGARVAAAPLPPIVKESPALLYSEEDSPSKTKALASELAASWGLVKTIEHSPVG